MQLYKNLLYKICTTAEQSFTGEKKKHELENILNYLKN